MADYPVVTAGFKGAGSPPAPTTITDYVSTAPDTRFRNRITTANPMSQALVIRGRPGQRVGLVEIDCQPHTSGLTLRSPPGATGTFQPSLMLDGSTTGTVSAMFGQVKTGPVRFQYHGQIVGESPLAGPNPSTMRNIRLDAGNLSPAATPTLTVVVRNQSNPTLAPTAGTLEEGEIGAVTKPDKGVIYIGDDSGNPMAFPQARSFHDPAGLASWRIIGDTLECWGNATMTGNRAAVTFPKDFATRPAISMTPDHELPGGVVIVTGRTFATGGAELRGFDAVGTEISATGTPAGANVTFYWHAIGKWDGTS